MKRLEINLAEVVAMILDIESSINVKCLSYGLYDKTNKEYISESNKDISFDYYEAYENKFRFKYTYDKSLKENNIIYLLKHHGEIYFPMLKKNTQKAYVAQFDVSELISKYGENYSVTPDKYFAEKFCWVTSKKEEKTNQQFEQMVLPLENMR